MDLIDRLKNLSERISKLKGTVTTEEGTKNAFIMPFIQALGYDVFNPLEVVPEFTADVGIKKGEKVDYCILKDGQPNILVECKCSTAKTVDKNMSQLHRYFHVTSARVAILTNGIIYHFYADLEKENVMDEKPFLEFNIENFSEHSVSLLKQFHKDFFDPDAILDAASDLKYTKEIKELLTKELKEPSEDFVRFIMSKVYSGRATAKAVESFTELVKKSANRFLADMLNEKLQLAINQTPPEKEQQKPEEVINEETTDIETTEEEMQGFRIVQAILAEKVDTDRIVARDVKTYFGILFDNNNRKPICRLHFNGSKKYIELFDDNKSGTKHAIDKVTDIYKFKAGLLKVVDYYGELVES